jgi:ribosomal protein S18 acetylase RimI-like enzyme
MNDFIIKKAEEYMIDDLVEVHRKALPRDLLPRLGAKYLRTVFYPTILRSDETFCTVAEVEGKVRAFVIFAKDSKRLTQSLAIKKVPLLWALVRQSAVDPFIVKAVWDAITPSHWELTTKGVSDLVSLPELYLIATHPDFQGRGLGERVMQAGLQQIIPFSKEVLVKTSSSKAREFYTKNRFVEVGVEARGVRKFFLLVRDVQT